MKDLYLIIKNYIKYRKRYKPDNRYIQLLFATDRNDNLSYKNKLPWNSKEDLTFLYSKLSGSDIIIGKNTYAAMKKALKKYIPNSNIIITSRKFGLLDCLAKSKNQNISIIGGPKIMQEAVDLGIPNIIYHTKFVFEYKGDLQFKLQVNHKYSGPVEILKFTKPMAYVNYYLRKE